jgi:hypothetical protein
MFDWLEAMSARRNNDREMMRMDFKNALRMLGRNPFPVVCSDTSATPFALIH